MKRYLSEFGSFFGAHSFLFGCSVLFVFLITFLKNLQTEGTEIFLSQRKSLVVEAFSATNLEKRWYPEIEKRLQSLEGVKKVVAISPEEGLKKLLSEPDLSIEPEWLYQKNAQLKNKNIILPWSFILHLDQWEEVFLEKLVEKIVNLKVGNPEVNAISQVYYDKERWSLTLSLYYYIRWITGILRICSFFFLIFVIFFSIKWFRAEGEDRKNTLKSIIPIVFLGILSGGAAHFLFLFSLSVYFFAQPFSLKTQLGHLLLFQMSLAILILFLGHGILLLKKKEKYR